MLTRILDQLLKDDKLVLSRLCTFRRCTAVCLVCCGVCYILVLLVGKARRFNGTLAVGAAAFLYHRELHSNIPFQLTSPATANSCILLRSASTVSRFHGNSHTAVNALPLGRLPVVQPPRDGVSGPLSGGSTKPRSS